MQPKPFKDGHSHLNSPGVSLSLSLATRFDPLQSVSPAPPLANVTKIEHCTQMFNTLGRRSLNPFAVMPINRISNHLIVFASDHSLLPRQNSTKFPAQNRSNAKESVSDDFDDNVVFDFLHCSFVWWCSVFETQRTVRLHCFMVVGLVDTATRALESNNRNILKRTLVWSLSSS